MARGLQRPLVVTRTRIIALALFLAACGADDGATPDAGALGDASPPTADADTTPDGTPDPCSATTQTTDPVWAEFVTWLEAKMAAEGIPGAAVAIVRGGVPVHTAVLGVKVPGRCGAVTADTLFKLAAPTELVTAVAVLSAVDDGTLDLDEAITANAPEFHVTSGDPSLIHLRHLLTHTSGIPSYAAAGACTTGSDPGDLARYWDEKNDLALWHPAGMAGLWSEWNYALAGLVLENAGGLSFDAAVQTRVFDKLGMVTATLDTAVAQSRDHAVGTYGATMIPAVDEDCTVQHPMRSAYVSLNDMIRFVGFLEAGDTSVLSETSRALLFDGAGEPDFVGGSAFWRGYGFRSSELSSGTSISGLTGGTQGGFVSEVTIVPSLDLAIVVLVNQAYDTQWQWTSITAKAAELLDGLVPAQPDTTLPLSRWSEYVGTYVDGLGLPGAPPPRTFDVVFDGTSLTISLGGITAEMLSNQAEDTFYFTYLGGVIEVRFTRDAGGVPIMIHGWAGAFGPPAFRQ